MTPEQVLNDIRSKRVKKAIIDTDAYNEMDDQYAIAYAASSDKIDLLSVNAAPFFNWRSTSFEDGMEKSYDEAVRVLETIGMAGKIPVYRGSRTRIGDNPGFAPSESEAADNIIRSARELDEPLYVMAIGAITNVASALLKDPSIAGKIVIIWLGGHCLDREALDEFNLIQDYAAGQIISNLDVPLVMLPAFDHGTCALLASRKDMDRITGDSPAAVFFRETLPREFSGEGYNEGWHKIIWDIAAPGVLAVPEAYEFSVIPAPVFAEGGKYAFDPTRRKILYMDTVDKEPIFTDVFGLISNL